MRRGIMVESLTHKHPPWTICMNNDIAVGHLTSEQEINANHIQDHFRVPVLHGASGSSGFQGALTCVIYLCSFVWCCTHTHFCTLFFIISSINHSFQQQGISVKLTFLLEWVVHIVWRSRAFGHSIHPPRPQEGKARPHLPSDWVVWSFEITYWFDRKTQ